MKMEGNNSGQQQQKCPKQRRASQVICYENNVMNLSRYGRATSRFVSRENKRRLNTIPENSVAVFDNTCHDYEWLHSSWITKECAMPNNRLYQYNCYGPLGQMYNTRYAMDCMCADVEKDPELIVLDK